MAFTIAIQPDLVLQKNGEVQSFSRRWTELAEAEGVRARQVDAFSPAIFDALKECDGFMWRFGYDPLSINYAKRLLQAVEHGLKIPVFPSWETAWHFEDKIAQHYLFRTAGIPAPRTWIFWQPAAALEFLQTATYPLVMKLALGVQSNNVRLLHDAEEGAYWVQQLFGVGVDKFEAPPPLLRLAIRGQKQVVKTLLGRPSQKLPRGIQHGYFYVQEFLPGNDFDTRVTIIGDRAFGFRRMNRAGDFRASGSGRIDWDPSSIDLPTVRLAFRIARHLDTQSVAIDGMRRGDERVVGEISYTYASWGVRECPGHWRLSGEPEVGELTWVEGKLRPEDAILEDFLSLVRKGRHVLGRQPELAQLA
jgi:glutathione synthase/RimK-type ligase-like ATP-grasp enzyme